MVYHMAWCMHQMYAYQGMPASCQAVVVNSPYACSTMLQMQGVSKMVCVHVDRLPLHATSAMPSYAKPSSIVPGRLHPCGQLQSSVVSHAILCTTWLDMPCIIGQSRLNQSICHTSLYLLGSRQTCSSAALSWCHSFFQQCQHAHLSGWRLQQ